MIETRAASIGAAASESAGGRKSGLVRPMALMGVLTLAVGVQAWIRWLLSPEFRPVPRGPDQMSAVRLALLHSFEALSFVVALGVLWAVVVRPLRRERQLSLDGKIVLAGLLAWWVDPLFNYVNLTFAYNGYAWNYGSWLNFIPGLIAPNQQNFGEPIAVAPTFVWWIFLSVVLGNGVLRMVKRRFPRISILGLLSTAFVFFAVADLVFELAVIIYGFQIWNYPSTIRALTLFAGNWYQFPLYEPVAIGILGTGVTAVRYFRDDQGRSFVESGLDGLPGGPRARGFASFLAVVGCVHGVCLLAISVWTFFALHVDSTAPAPSYLRTELCGAGTDYACPSSRVPIPSRTSLHIEPNDPRLLPPG